MPSGLQTARKTLADAERELARLQEERESFSAQLQETESTEREAIHRRAGLTVIAEAGRLTDAARAQLAQTEAELESLLERLPGLADRVEREEMLSTLSAACSDGTEAEAKLRAALGDLAGVIRDPLERVMAAHMELASAQAQYHATGRELVPGWVDKPGGMVPAWEGNSGERLELEAELRRRGNSVNPLLGDLEPPSGEDPLERWAFNLYRRAVAEHRASVAKEAEERERAETKRRAKLEEERERRALSATLTVPAAHAEEVIAALSSLPIRSSTEIRQRVPGPVENYVESVRIGIPQPDSELARRLLYDALGASWVTQNILFQDDERAYYLRS